MIIHFKRLDGELTAGEFISKIPTDRTCFRVMDGCYMQVDDEKIVARHDGPVCWRCWGTHRVHAKTSKKFFDCPACKYQPEEEAIENET